MAGASDEPAALETPPPSRRLRTCASGLGSFVTNLFAPILPEPAPPPPRVVVVNGVRMSADGKTPLRLPRKAREQVALLDSQADAREQLLALGINPSEGLLKYLSPKRLKEFYDMLDAPKKHIFCKAPKIANTLATQLLEECSRDCLVSVALPYGSKKGNTQSATVRLKVVDPPYNPDDKTPRPGLLRMMVAVEAGKRTLTISGVSSSTGPDNVITIKLGPDGQMLLSTTDEPTRWKWVLAINAGLHRVAAIKCMMDQAAGIMPWYPTAGPPLLADPE